MLPGHLIGRRQWAIAVAAATLLPLRLRAQASIDASTGLAWPPALVEEAVALLAGAADHGLDPRDYGADAWRHDLADAPASALTAAFLRFLNHLAFGRVDPLRVHHRVSVAPRAGFDAALALQAALASGRLADAVEAAAPPLPGYRQLREALAALRPLAGHAAWARRLPALPVPPGTRSARLDPGQGWHGLPHLAERLRLLGDLPTDASVPRVYGGQIVDAVRTFQQRHGLAVDGVLGRATMAALEVTPADRARQIALTMERLRWTPLMHSTRMVVVNIPEFTLRAYEVVGGQIRMRAQMRVIVGEAMDHETPLFDERMRSIEFSPYWNVPPSIARKEIIPRVRRDPGYWRREGFEFVGTGGVDTVLAPDKLGAVLAGRLRIRQRPGPANALGDIKFIFPNRDFIYLHHTPSVGLFARARRDFSHGCIRVEEPVALARFVMEGMPGWDEARIRQRMAAGTSTTIALVQPLQVVIAYATALVKDGRIHFFDDVYGHDARLQAALDARLVPASDFPRR